MRIYVDEAGPFVGTGSDSFSLVLALVIPSASEKELFYDFLRLRDEWPVKAIELKGSSLDESQTAQVVEVCLRHDVLVEFTGLNMATHDHVTVEEMKRRQADELTAHMTPQHQASLVQQLQQMSDRIRKLPNQLFLQAFTTIRLLLGMMEEVLVYYVQRVPEELGDIAWTIDRKNHTLTQMEEMWSTLISPISESHFAKEPFGRPDGFDYSHFDKRYAFTKDNIGPEMARHLEWLRETYGFRPFEEDDIGVNAGRLFSEQRDFKDSRDSLGLQLADILAATLRRALNRNLQIAGWKDFGRLMIRRKNIGSYFIQVGRAGSLNMPRHATSVCRVLDRRAKIDVCP